VGRLSQSCNRPVTHVVVEPAQAEEGAVA
jgi:hypothetical protein